MEPTVRRTVEVMTVRDRAHNCTGIFSLDRSRSPCLFFSANVEGSPALPSQHHPICFFLLSFVPLLSRAGFLLPSIASPLVLLVDTSAIFSISFPVLVDASAIVLTSSVLFLLRYCRFNQLRAKQNLVYLAQPEHNHVRRCSVSTL